MLLDPQPIKARLENLEIANELIVQPRLPIHFRNGDFARIDDIHDLAIDTPCTEGLNPWDIDLNGGNSTCRS